MLLLRLLGGEGINKEGQRVSKSWSIKSENFWQYLPCWNESLIGKDFLISNRDWFYSQWRYIPVKSVLEVKWLTAVWESFGWKSLLDLCSFGISTNFPLTWVHAISSRFQVILSSAIFSLMFSLKYFRRIWVPPSKDSFLRDDKDFNSLFKGWL